MPALEPTSWATLAKTGYDVAKSLGLWVTLKRKLRRRRVVLVLGASGAGKSQFIQSLKTLEARASGPTRRTVGRVKKDVEVREFPFQMIDTPGQVYDEAVRKSAITEAIQRGIWGIINVVCFGYHQADEAPRAIAVPSDDTTVARDDYLRRRQQLEIDLLSEWVPRFDKDTAYWVLTVITKADLWWPDIGERIRNHYEDPKKAYRRSLGELSEVSHQVPYCSTIEPFYGGRTGGRFGDQERLNLRGHLLDTLLNLTGTTQ
jgi:energy-coupling factor transporter ATP-binding protein EcfA2